VHVRGYQVMRLLSAQPHSRVYLASTTGSAPFVVLKELLFTLVPDTQALEAFQREAELLRQLSHPRLPSFIDAFQEGTDTETRLYLVMSHVEGVSLEEELKTHRYSEAEVLELAAQGLELLVYLHGLSPHVIHRDIKPANLLRRPDGTLALVDFGAAREVHRATAGQATLVGTLGYMPPEQLAGVARPGSDVYALGATLLHLLSRKHPSELMGEGLRLEFREHVNLRPPTLRFLERLVHPTPRKRFTTATEALEALTALRSGRASLKRVLAFVGAGLGVAGALAAGVLVLGPRLRSEGGVTSEAPRSTPSDEKTSPTKVELEIVCPDGAQQLEDLAKRIRWCSRVTPNGHPVPHGPLVRWGDRHELRERSTYADDKLHGPQVFFESGFKSREGAWRHGKKVGTWITYSSYEHKEFEKNYQDDVLEGPSFTYEYDGQVREQGAYSKGEKQGPWTRFGGVDGKEWEAVFEQGQYHGPYTAWHIDGRTVKEQGTYTHGNKTGTWVEYHPNGQKKSEGAYEQGRQQGEWRAWHDNGKPASQGLYASGKRVGPWLWWHASGPKEKEGAYDDAGQESGNWTRWYDNGKKHWSFVYQRAGIRRFTSWHDNGRMESQGMEKSEGSLAGVPSKFGPWNSWHANGRKKSTTFYREDGDREGVSTHWHDNGRKASEGHFRQDLQKGKWRWWDREGKLQREENFGT
jgi:serine/threonine protein kinase